MSNRKITDMVALTTPASDDVLPIVDISEAAAVDKNKKISIQELFKGVPDGTAAAPSIAFESDDDSGIFLAGTNTVGITTAGTQRVTVDGSGNVTIDGDLTVNGATTTIDTTSLIVEDKNIEMGVVSTPTNTTADGGGITLKGATDKTITWVDSTGCWTFNQPTNFNNHVRIDSSGNVGINDSSPSSLGTNITTLEVKGGSATRSGGIRLSTSDDSQKAAFYVYDGSGIVGTETAHPLGLYTGNTERVRIDSSGKVAIGSTSPEFKFMVADAGYSGIEIKSNRTGATENIGGLHFKTGSTSVAYIQSLVDGTFRFRNTSSLTERMRIDSSGNVGIGTSSPGKLLSLQDSTTPSLALYTGSTIRAELKGTSALTSLLSYSNSPITFNIGGSAETEALRIDGSGNVGIGTTAPLQLLHVSTGNNSNSGEVSIALGGSTASARSALVTKDTSTPFDFKIVASQSASVGSAFVFETKPSTEAARIDSSGRLLVGTTTEGRANATDNLTIAGSGDSGITIRSGTTGDGAIDFSDGTSGTAEYRGQILYDHNSDAMRLMTASSERLRIDSSGRVGIGIVPSSSPLEVLSGASNSSLIEASGASAGRGLKISTYANIANDAGVLIEAPHANYGQLAFGTAGSERLRIDSSGNVGIGATSASGKLHISTTDSTNSPRLLFLENLGQGNNTGSTIYFRNRTGTAFTDCSIQGLGTGTNQSALVFSTEAGGGPTERMRIDHSGRVLVGASSVGYTNAADNLTIEDSGHCGITLRSGSSNSGNIYFSDSTGQGAGTYAGIVEYNHASNYMQFWTNSSQRLRIDSSGNVGIGTSSPSSYSSTANELVVAGTSNPGITIAGSSGNTGTIMFADGTSGSEVYRGQIDYQHASDAMVFFTNGGSERMRIDSSGTILIGGTGAIDSGVGFSLQAQSSEDAAEIKVRTNGQNAIQFRSSANGDTGKITVNASTTVYATSSDYRLKQNVVNIADGITRVKQLQPKRFNFIADDTTTVDGFLAHEAQTVVPEAVTGTHNEVDADGNAVMQGIDQSKLVPLLTAALQEAIAKIETLETKVAALEAG